MKIIDRYVGRNVVLGVVDGSTGTHTVVLDRDGFFLLLHWIYNASLLQTYKVAS